MIPSFSIKNMLWAIVAFAILSLAMGSAARGNRIAFGLSVAIIGSFIPFLTIAAVHWFSFLVALIPIPGMHTQAVGGSPFGPGRMETNSIVNQKSVSTEANGSDSGSEESSVQVALEGASSGNELSTPEATNEEVSDD